MSISLKHKFSIFLINGITFVVNYIVVWSIFHIVQAQFVKFLLQFVSKVRRQMFNWHKLKSITRIHGISFPSKDDIGI